MKTHRKRVPAHFLLGMLLGLLNLGAVGADVSDLSELKSNAGKGNALAQTLLGINCLRGREGDEKDGVRWFRLAADQGYTPAQWMLGRCYLAGQGVDKDEKEGVKWFRLAAEKDLAEAHTSLGFCFLEGCGVEKDEVEAVKLFRRAADRDSPIAHLNLGVCYLLGHGVEKNEAEAFKWFSRAAEQGIAQAQYNLGTCHLEGWGTSKDAVKAVEWFRMAAKQGSSMACLQLGVCYVNGSGVSRDLLRAHAWFTLAESHDDVADRARAARLQIASTMSPEQIAGAGKLAEKLLNGEEDSDARKGDAPPENGKIVREVRLSATDGTKIDENRLKASLGTQVGKAFGEAAIERDIEILYSTGLFDNVDVTTEDVKDGVVVIVTVTGREKVGKVTFEGNRLFDSEVLRKTAGVSVNDPLDDQKVHDGAQKICDKYHDKGYADILVEYDTQPLPEKQGFVSVVYSITEGGPGTINNIRFEGLTAVKRDVICSKMKLKEKTKLSNDDLQEDIRTIERAIQDLGYVYAKIDQVRREPIKDDQCDLVFVLDEGNRYTVSEVRLEGNRAFSKDKIAPSLLAKAGKPYSASDISADEKMLGDYYASRGYANARVDTSVAPDGDNAVKLTYRIEEGYKYMVGKVNIAGNAGELDGIIRHELKLAPRDILNATLVEKARETLKQLGYFLAVDIRLNPTEKPGYMDIDIDLLEP